MKNVNCSDTINNQVTCSVSEYKGTCFSYLTEEEQNFLNENSVFVNYKKGETVCKQGTFISHIMAVEKGLAKVFINGNAGNLIIRIIPEGRVIGLSSISEEKSLLKYSVETYVDSVIRLIDINAFRDIVKQNSEFAFELIKLLSANSDQVNGRFYCLSNKQSFGKLADILICLSDSIFKSREFELLLSRKDLAELTGMTPENLIRLLKKFREDKLIEIKGKVFKMLNYKKLRAISMNG